MNYIKQETTGDSFLGFKQRRGYIENNHFIPQKNNRTKEKKKRKSPENQPDFLEKKYFKQLSLSISFPILSSFTCSLADFKIDSNATNIKIIPYNTLN